jgi:fructose 1,6-bisphosphatase
MLISYDIIGSIGGSKVMSNKEFKLMSKKQWRDLANSCLDFIVDSIGIDNTLIMLFKNGVSKENLIELHFSLYDIEKAHNFYKNWEDQE